MKTPFLSSLGVLDMDQARNPTPNVYPHAFNVNCKPVWDTVVRGMEMSASPSTNWGTAIKLFVELCIDQAKYPFSNLKQSANDQIITVLRDARKSVVKFMNVTNMLDYVHIKATRRVVEMNNTGFSLCVYGIARLKDPTFEKWLLQMPYPRFNLKSHGKYVKQLSNNVSMVVYNEGASLSQRWHVGYEIVCHTFPSLPGKDLPSKESLERFILDVLWMPVLKAHRPRGFHHRLI